MQARARRVEERGVAEALLHQAQRSHAVVKPGVQRAHQVDEVHLRTQRHSYLGHCCYCGRKMLVKKYRPYNKNTLSGPIH